MAELQEEDLLSEFYLEKPKLKLPNDRQIHSMNELYRPSFRTLTFASEVDRKFFAESFTHEPVSKIPENLAFLAMKVYAENYKGGKIDNRITLDNLTHFGELIDIELALKDIFQLGCNAYWKRVVDSKSKDSIKLERLIQDPKTNWKKKGVEYKLTEMIETTAPENWNYKELVDLSFKVSEFVEELVIKSLKPLKKFDHKYVDEHMENIPLEVCHHGSLAFLEHLKNLHTISIRFACPPVAREYRPEKFQHSYEDIEHLSRGIRNLCSLKILQIKDSPMDNLKMDRLLTEINNCVQLEEIDFSNCQMLGDCMVAVGLYLSRTPTLRRIELQENRLDNQGMRGISYGLQKTKSRLKYLGLARNPLKHIGVEELGKGIALGRNVADLNLCGCELEKEGTYRIAHIIQLKAGITHLDISCIEFSKNAGDALLGAVRDNFELLGLECRDSLTQTQELSLQIFVQRNCFYQANPCMIKDNFTKEDEVEIDAWLKRIKHPLLIEEKEFVNQLLWKEAPKKSENIPFAEKSDRTKHSIDVPPEIMKLREKAILNNDQILGVELVSSYRNEYKLTDGHVSAKSGGVLKKIRKRQ